MLEIKGKNVTVVGLARSGVGAANLLTAMGANVTVTDIKTRDDLMPYVRRLHEAVRQSLGGHPETVFTNADLIVISPGVSPEIPPVAKAKAKGIPVTGELELSYQMIDSRAPFLSVTGTNGKSTTTALLDFMMNKGGYKTILGGNIGNALTEEISRRLEGQSPEIMSPADTAISERIHIDYIVAEVSSFQLETIREFRPTGAVIVNITPDHLDRYHSLQEYSDAKARIFENQTENDFLVLNRDDPETMRVAHEKLSSKKDKPRVVYFSRKQAVDGLYAGNGMVYCSITGMPSCSSSLPLIGADEIRIKGVHNLENAMAASAMALLAGCRIEAVAHSLREFPGLEHRLEFVRELQGVMYFNDSKGTNVGAVLKSLESFTRPVILIAGGRDKAGEFSLLRELVKERVKAIVLIGEASEKIKKALGDITDTAVAKDLKQAVDIARNSAVQGDIVLLSPACASFDMFENFEDRGRQFKQIVMELR